jgi:putative flippase GtrA
MRLEVARFARFCAVGALNTLLTLAAFAALTAAGVPAPAASAAAFALGAANGYVLNRTWTFRATGGAATLARYVAVQALGAASSAAGVALVTNDLELRRIAAEVVVLPVVSALTYSLSRTLVFRAPSRIA